MNDKKQKGGKIGGLYFSNMCFCLPLKKYGVWFLQIKKKLFPFCSFSGVRFHFSSTDWRLGCLNSGTNELLFYNKTLQEALRKTRTAAAAPAVGGRLSADRAKPAEKTFVCCEVQSLLSAAFAKLPSQPNYLALFIIQSVCWRQAPIFPKARQAFLCISLEKKKGLLIFSSFGMKCNRGPPGRLAYLHPCSICFLFHFSSFGRNWNSRKQTLWGEERKTHTSGFLSVFWEVYLRGSR